VVHELREAGQHRQGQARQQGHSLSRRSGRLKGSTSASGQQERR
jgi:hypothetical protein